MCISIKLDDIVNDYNNTYHRTMKPVDVKDNTYIDSSEKVNDKDPKFKNADHLKISKYKSIFAKRYTRNQSEDFFVIKDVRWNYWNLLRYYKTLINRNWG